MKNLIGMSPEKSRKDKYDEIETKKDEKIEKIEKIEGHFGHAETDDLLANMCRESLNAIMELPQLPRKKMLEAQVKIAQKRLKGIYEKDRDEANKLNERYNEIIKRAIETEDDTERNAFEENELGMSKQENIE